MRQKRDQGEIKQAQGLTLDSGLQKWENLPLLRAPGCRPCYDHLSKHSSLLLPFLCPSLQFTEETTRSYRAHKRGAWNIQKDTVWAFSSHNGNAPSLILSGRGEARETFALPTYLALLTAVRRGLLKPLQANEWLKKM